MKRGHKKLLIFEVIVIILLLLNSFIWNMLSGYNMFLFLMLLAVLLKISFGFEKDKNRYVKDMIIEIIIMMIIFFIMYYILGYFIGYVRIENYYNFYGIKTFILPTILIIIVKEFLRYGIIKKAEGSKITVITTLLLFILIDLTTNIYYQDFSNVKAIYEFITMIIIPAIVNNLIFTYISTKLGYKTNIIYLLIFELYKYLIPIIPNPNEYLDAVIRIILPIILGLKIYKFFEEEKDEYPKRENKRKSMISLTICSVLVIMMVYLTSGQFKYYGIAIGSGSMTPAINKGDMVVVEKIKDYEKIEKKDILAYKYGNITVVHRVEKILRSDGEYYFYTKGDANLEIDNYAIKEEAVIGIVKLRVPYIGIPTVWLSEL